jgi:hypothetical protein
MIQSTLLLAGFDQTIYTSANTNAITTMVFCNTATPDASDESVRAVSLQVHLVKATKTKNFSNTIIKNLVIPAGETLFFDTERVVLDNGDSMVATTSGANRTASITGITVASQAVITSAGHLLEAGNYIGISGVAGIVNIANPGLSINGGTYQVTQVNNANEFVINFNSVGYSAYTSGGIFDSGHLAATVSTLTV